MATLIFCCGAECSINATGSAPGAGTRHYNTLVGTVTVDTGTFHSPGTKSYKVTSAAGAQNYLGRDMPASIAKAVARFWVNFSSLPSADCNIFGFVAAAGSYCTVFFKQSDSKIYAALGTAPGATGVTVTTGQWYQIDIKGDCSGGTRTCDVQVDGTACGQASSAIALSTFTATRFGGNITTTTANHTHFIDDLAISTTDTDYPIGTGVVVGLLPNADGTHNFNTAGDFKYEDTTNVATSATDTNTHVVNLTTTIGNFISCNAASNTEYLEWRFASTPSDVSTINAAMVVMASHSAGTAANKQTLRLNDNGTTNDAFADLDQSQTSICYNDKIYLTAPSTGVAWTKTRMDAIRVRWNSSYGTVDETPVPYVDGVIFEVDYVQTVAGGQPAMRRFNMPVYGVKGVQVR